MAYYKIKNVTNTLGKRDSKVNTAQTVEFKDIIGMTPLVIPAGAEVIVEATYLPVSAQKLRAEGLINVIEIDRNSYQKMLNAQDARVAEQSRTRPIAEQPAKVKDGEEKSKKYKEKVK